jgi:hypothetical protein
MTTLAAHRSASKPKKPTAAKAPAHKPVTKPVPGWMQSPTEAPLEGWTPPANPGGKPPTRPAPPAKGTPKIPAAPKPAPTLKRANVQPLVAFGGDVGQGGRVRPPGGTKRNGAAVARRQPRRTSPF